MLHFTASAFNPRICNFGAAQIMVLLFPQCRRKCYDVATADIGSPTVGGDGGRRPHVGPRLARFGIPAGLNSHQKNSPSGVLTHSFQQCHPRQAIRHNNRRRAAGHQQQAISDKPSATSHQQPTTSSQPPVTSDNHPQRAPITSHQPVTSATAAVALELVGKS